MTSVIKGSILDTLDCVVIPFKAGLCSNTNSNELQSVLLQQNTNHFSQFSEIPFANSLLSNTYPLILQYPGTTDKLLCGNLQNFHSQPETIQELLASLKKIPLFSDIKIILANKDVIYGFKH